MFVIRLDDNSVQFVTLEWSKKCGRRLIWTEGFYSNHILSTQCAHMICTHLNTIKSYTLGLCEFHKRSKPETRHCEYDFMFSAFLLSLSLSLSFTHFQKATNDKRAFRDLKTFPKKTVLYRYVNFQTIEDTKVTIFNGVCWYMLKMLNFLKIFVLKPVPFRRPPFVLWWNGFSRFSVILLVARNVVSVTMSGVFFFFFCRSVLFLVRVC